MTLYASKSRQAFYDSALHDDIPGDAVEISRELRDLLAQAGVRIDWSGDEPRMAEYQGLDDEQAAASARATRDNLLRTVYDPAVAMLQRAGRLDPPHAEQYAAKLEEFDAWAVALQGVPEQAGFPHSIDWPEQPTAEAL